MPRCLIAGGGGFIGGWLAGHLIKEGYEVRAVDIKPVEKWFQVHGGAANWGACDLALKNRCFEACEDVDYVYNLAADMGGMGFIENNKADCMLSVLINTHLLRAAHYYGIKRYFYASSACVYAADKQNAVDMPALKESDAYPAMPEDGYGWEKLFSERMCRHFTEDYGLETRVARFHNVYGPHGSWTGGREKAPAAICRKVIEAIRAGSNEIDVWGDGTQQRSYMWIGDCIEGTRRLMDSDVTEPINIGSREMVSVDGLIDTACEIGRTALVRKYQPSKPKGVAGRNSDNTLIKKLLGWEPSTSLLDGLSKTYPWIEEQARKQHG